MDNTAHTAGGRTTSAHPSVRPGPTVAPARQRLFVQSARRSTHQPQQSQLPPRARPSSASVRATSSASRAEQKQLNTRPRSSRERNHATGSSNRQLVYGTGGMPRPQSAWADVGRKHHASSNSSTSRPPVYYCRDPATSGSSASDVIIGERRTKTFTRDAVSARTETSVKRRQRRKVPGYETNSHRIKIGSDKAAVRDIRRPSSAAATTAAVSHSSPTAADTSTCAPHVPRPYQRKEDVNLIRRVAEKLASLGPAQAKYRNNLQSLEAKSSNPDKLLSRQQLCEGFVRFGFHKREIERLYDMFAETRKAQACGGVKVLDFLDFFEYFTPLDRLTGRDEETIDIATPDVSDDPAEKKRGKGNRAISYAGPQPSVQSSAPWNRPQSLRPTVTEVPDHSFSDMVSPEALASDTARAFDVHLLNIVRDLLYHKDNIFRTAFRKMDVNRDGRISRPEFRSSLKEMGLNLRQSSRLAEIIDADANDEIDYNEFLAAFEGYNPIERAAAFKENHMMRGAHKAGHTEMVENVRSFLRADDASHGARGASNAQEEVVQSRGRPQTSSSSSSLTSAAQCFEVLSGKLREREAMFLHALKVKDVDNNGIIPVTSAIDAIIGIAPSLEEYRGEVGAFVDTVSSETGNVRYREMLRVFKDADSGLSVSRSAQRETSYRQPNLLNSMRPTPSPSMSMARPMSAPTAVSAVYRGGGPGSSETVSCDAIEKQQEAYLASRRRLLLHKAAKPQHHRRRYDCVQRTGPPSSSSAERSTTTVAKRADPHWFDVVYGPERRVGRFASTPTPDSSALRRMI